MIPQRLLAATALSVLAAAGQTTVPLFHPNTIRVLILSGRNNHDWRTTTPALRKILLDTGRFDVRVTEEPMGLTAETLAAYHAVVSDYNGPRLGATAEKALEDYVRSGRGLVVVHAADYAFGSQPVLGDNHVRTPISEAPWSAWFDMTGGTWVQGTGHAPRGFFKVRFTDRAHPIAAGMPEEFDANDELYHRLKMGPNVHVLATAFDDPARGGVGPDVPVLWTINYGSGRMFHTTLGHDVSAMNLPGFIASFTRGVEWAATGAVAPAAPAAEPKPPVRVLVVTGGHSYPPSFDTIFDQQPGLRVMVDPHPHAFRGDFRKGTDVLVLYDSLPDLAESNRAHLREFLESGKGLVVLHHAVADYNDWEWWWKDVVGGKYQLKDAPGFPMSHWKEGLDMKIRPTGKHPVLKGISTMQFVDEAYRDMWISDKVTPILTTDHPASDKLVGWVSPYDKSRVVVITLGHGAEAHHDPMFRKLVQNAIRWAGE
jgi:type 1 glutamine amidotransferase